MAALRRPEQQGRAGHQGNSAAWHRAAAKRAAALLPPELIQRVGESMESTSANEVCAFSSIAAEAILQLPEPYRSWQLTRFVQGMQ
jgi:hypothetical protein